MTATPWAGRRLHFIAIGGAGMSGLAAVAHRLGAAVTGSDSAVSAPLERLRGLGLAPAVGHDAANVPEDAEVVVSTAIGERNPELAAARARGQRVLHRGDLLAEVTALKRSLAITGTHGKTTTASMAAHVLIAAGRDPAYLIGGDLRSSGTNAAWGAGEWIVVEADESDRSFLKLSPDVAVVTNVELDHHATYRSERELAQAVGEFAARAPTRVVWDEVELPGLGPAREVTFGIGRGALRAEALELTAGGARFHVEDVEVALAVPGRHNVLNALAALAACREVGLALADAAPALASFAGARRRFEPHGRTAAGAAVYDDYAHHPTEVRATLEAARTLAPARLVACFQPHLFSRTRHLAREFGRALALADVIVVLDVYPARERAADHPGVSGWLVAAEAASAAGGRPVYWAPRHEDAEALLARTLSEGDLLVTLGAGDVDRVARALTGEAGAAAM